MVPMSGKTEANGTPTCFYEYSVEHYDRTATGVHVRLWLTLWMATYSSYYSFKIAHECKVNGVYQYADVKTDRTFWGHQWEYSWWEDGLGWDEGSANYDGTFHHGPYLVFDGVVPMAPGDADLHIVPCITQPPITGMGGGGIYVANYQDINNWAGMWGWWRPFGDDEMLGSYTPGQLGVTPASDGPWLNNRGLQELAVGPIGTFAVPSAPSSVVVAPQSIDVSAQRTTPIVATWPQSANADSYDVMFNRQPVDIGATATVSATTFSHVPRTAQAGGFWEGDRVYVGVRASDAYGTKSATTWSSPVTYTRVPATGPSFCEVDGERGTNVIFYRGESANVRFGGMSKGSYDLSTFELYDLTSGTSLARWDVGDVSGYYDPPMTSLRTYGPVTFPGDRPKAVHELEIRAWDAHGDPAYATSGAWHRFTVTYDAGDVWVYDRPHSVWREGPAWAWDGARWHRGDTVWVYAHGEWRTL